MFPFLFLLPLKACRLKNKNEGRFIVAAGVKGKVVHRFHQQLECHFAEFENIVCIAAKHLHLHDWL